MNIQKVINKTVIYEIGDFFGGDGEQDVIKSMHIDNHRLIITTTHEHDFPIQGGTWVKFMDGTSFTFEDEEDGDGTE